MIGLGINTMVWSGGYREPLLSLFPRIRDWGYDVVELPVFDFAAVDPAPVRRALAASGLALTVTSAMPARWSMVSEDAGTRARTRMWLQAAIEKVAAMGGSILAGPMYLPVGELPGRHSNSSEWSWAVEEYRSLASAIAGGGVRLALEPLNRFETYFLNTACDAGRLCDEIASESIGVLFDTFHANIEEEDVIGALGTLGRHLIHVHLSENNRGVPGSGHVPFQEVARYLRNVGYSGYAVVESFASTIPELARATAMWRDYAESPDAFACSSMVNLRPLFREA